VGGGWGGGGGTLPPLGLRGWGGGEGVWLCRGGVVWVWGLWTLWRGGIVCRGGVMVVVVVRCRRYLALLLQGIS
jgi:hypothetical protein